MSKTFILFALIVCLCVATQGYINNNILTPFTTQKQESCITDKDLLSAYRLAHKFSQPIYLAERGLTFMETDKKIIKTQFGYIVFYMNEHEQILLETENECKYNEIDLSFMTDNILLDNFGFYLNFL